MISVAAALDHICRLSPVLPIEEVTLAEASGRVLRIPVVAQRDQPPFAASSMDGYAISGLAEPGACFRIIGESQAGKGFGGTVASGQAVRIFTGAPVPKGAQRVIIQEDVTREGDLITLGPDIETSLYIRPQGYDFKSGVAFDALRRLKPADLALIAAMNVPTVSVSRRPEVAILATGDELVMPGEAPDTAQIVASNSFALKAIAEAEGARARLLPIARDCEDSLRAAFELARDADLLVTIGGASVGAYDLVGQVAESLGAQRAFFKVAMRPGKPLMAGTLGRTMLLGLPGNPVSAIVCGHLFMPIVLRRMQGLKDDSLPAKQGILAVDLPPNGPRAHFMRARWSEAGHVAPFEDQDSALLSTLAQAEMLLIRPAHDPARQAGEQISYILL